MKKENKSNIQVRDYKFPFYGINENSKSLRLGKTIRIKEMINLFILKIENTRKYDSQI